MEAQAIYTVVIGVGGLMVVVTPIIKLNSSITKLTTLLEMIREDNKKQDGRLDSHSKKIDNHEIRITKLER